MLAASRVSAVSCQTSVLYSDANKATVYTAKGRQSNAKDTALAGKAKAKIKAADCKAKELGFKAHLNAKILVVKLPAWTQTAVTKSTNSGRTMKTREYVHQC